MVVIERVLVILLVVPITAKFHVKALPVVLHVISNLSPTQHTAALGEGDIVTVPANI